MSAPALSTYFGGQGSVSADQLNTFTQWSTTAISLRNFTGLSNMMVIVEGTNTVNDDGAGVFYWNSTSTARDDGIDVIVPNGSIEGAWIRLAAFGAGGQVYVSQLKQGLAVVDTAARPAVAGFIPANPYDPVTICWTGALFVVGDALYQFVQAQLHYTNAQMTAFYATCASYPVTPT